ncbi:putative xanthine dehydrogenase subunit A [Parageobacillus caldoxylosilyticus]|uniref:XdhC family protein n=1 Tax=Saccharococcus caldoxylosilyticus TaxID=81408 RepID=UPI001C4DFA08|nr:XdhC/CoxI family protein [Parageobacillus caldoxylosilyticus]QXJ37129.1 putative xanthine dehydrogenase subunit A [Parageobacillus caldoxylosilyticus]
MIAIKKELERCKKEGLSGVLGTIISTEGSTYQKTGAKCFISEDRRLTGLLSGGCVESDIIEHAMKVLETGKPTVVHYDFYGDDDIVWGLGVGCNGKMNIFLQPYLPVKQPEKAAIIDRYFSDSLQKTLHTVTIVKAKDESLEGKMWVIDGAFGNNNLPISLHEIAADYMRRKRNLKNGVVYLGGEQDLYVYYESTSPPPHLIVFGAGPDAIPLVKMAKNLKWLVTVLDYRPSYCNEQNFPDADFIHVYPSGSVPNISLYENSYVVIMTHNFLHDREILESILNSDAAYIGLLGPRKRTDRLIATSNTLISNENVRRIHSPIGLDIGAKTPEEIALSILAEIMMVYRGGTGKKLSQLSSMAHSV